MERRRQFFADDRAKLPAILRLELTHRKSPNHRMSHSGNWSFTDIDGHVVEVFEPAERDVHQGTILYLHDQRGRSLREFPTLVTQLTKRGFRLFSPQAGPTWWLDRIVPTFDQRCSPRSYVIDRLIPELERSFGVNPSRLALLGLRMGGQGALGLAYRYPDRFPIVAAITPAIDFQLLLTQYDDILSPLYCDVESARQDTVILHVHPLNWPRHQFFCCDPLDPFWFSSAERLRMKLGSLGVPFVCDLQTSTNDELAYPCRMAEAIVDFISERLDQERRRIPTVHDNRTI